MIFLEKCKKIHLKKRFLVQFSPQLHLLMQLIKKLFFSLKRCPLLLRLHSEKQMLDLFYDDWALDILVNKFSNA